MICSFPNNKYDMTISHHFNEVLALVIIIKMFTLVLAFLQINKL